MTDNQLNIKLGQFTHELNVVLTKIKNRKATSLHGIPPEVWKIRKFNDLLLQYCNAVYNQNIRDGQNAASSLSSRKVTLEFPITTEV